MTHRVRGDLQILPYLTDASDAHIQRFGTAACTIQNFGSQFNDQEHSQSLALQGTWRAGIIIERNPFVKMPLILDIIVG